MPCAVIESKCWRHISGRTASLYGAAPWTSAADKANWSIESRGWTVQNPDGTIGCGKPPCKTQAEAQELADRLNATRFAGMNQG